MGDTFHSLHLFIAFASVWLLKNDGGFANHRQCLVCLCIWSVQLGKIRTKIPWYFPTQRMVLSPLGCRDLSFLWYCYVLSYWFGYWGEEDNCWCYKMSGRPLLPVILSIHIFLQHSGTWLNHENDSDEHPNAWKSGSSGSTFSVLWIAMNNLRDLEQRERVFRACQCPASSRPKCPLWDTAWKSPAWDTAVVCNRRERSYITEWHFNLCPEVTALHLLLAKACHKDGPDTGEECGIW